MNWYLKVLKNYAGFSGRARRMEYWIFTLVNAIIFFVIGLLEVLLSLPGIVGQIYILAILVPSFAVLARRLHDTDRSAWWILISFVPLIGFLILLYFTVQDSTPGTNRFGINPKEIDLIY